MTIIEHLDKLMPLMGEHFIDLVIWRNATVTPKSKYNYQYQPIMVYSKTENYVFHSDVEKVPKHNIVPGKPSNYMGRVGNIWADIKFVHAGCIVHKEAILRPGTKSKIHPCQMPLGLPRRAIRFSTDPEAIVLDPFCGVGATCVAAKELGRHWIGIDRNEEYCDIARRRVAGQSLELSPVTDLQPNLFNFQGV